MIPSQSRFLTKYTSRYGMRFVWVISCNPLVAGETELCTNILKCIFYLLARSLKCYLSIQSLASLLTCDTVKLKEKTAKTA